MSEFTKKQEAAIKALERLHARFDKLGLVMWSAVEDLHVIRKRDVKRYMEEERGNVSATDCINFMEHNGLPVATIGFIGGGGD